MKYQFLKAFSLLSPTDLADLALKMAEKHPSTFERLVIGDAAADSTTFEVPLSGSKVTFTSAQMRELNGYGAGQKITAIKRVREITQLGLKEAKDLVEAQFNNCSSGFGRY